MKTESQVVQRMEQVVDRFVQKANSLADDISKVTEQEKMELNADLTAIATLGWVMDCEGEVQILLSKINIAAKLQEMGKT